MQRESFFKKKIPPFVSFLYVALHFPVQFPPLLPREPGVSAHVCLRAGRSSLLPLYLTACQIYVVPVCRSTSPSHLSLFLISKPSYFTHVALCNLRSSRPAVFLSTRPGAPESVSAILVST